MNYVGDYNPGQIVYIYFNTFTSNDPSASATITDFLDTDVHIHKDDSLTQRNDTAGVAIDVDVDGITGSHFISIDTSDNTVDDFFVAGHDYFVRIEGTTVDAGTINAVVGSFSLGNRAVAGWMASAAMATLASQVSFTLSQGSADDDAYNNCTVVVTDQATTIQKCMGLISDYAGGTKTVTLAEDPGIFTMAAGDNVQIFASSALANVRAVNGTLQTANDNGADINAILVDTGTTLDGKIDTIDTNVDAVLVDTGTTLDGKIDTIDTNVDAILVDTGTTLDGKLPAALVGGRMDSTVDATGMESGAVDQIWDEALTETTGAPAITGTIRAFMSWWAGLSRNKMTQTATTSTLRDDADGADLATSTVSDDGTTFVRGEWST